MSAVTHAPGLWGASFSFPGRDGIGDVWQIDADGHAVCTTQFCYAPHTEANARLIAAAPELLEALREARDALHQHYVDWDGEPEDAVPLQLARTKCESAIAKATAGETRNAEPIHRRDGDEG